MFEEDDKMDDQNTVVEEVFASANSEASLSKFMIYYTDLWSVSS
jgi:hypothetical protein